MTLALAIVSADGIVVAADSRTTLQIAPEAPTRVLSDFTHKVFQVREAAVATYGYAFLAGRNIAGHMSEFVRDNDPEEQTLRDTVERLTAFFGGRFDSHVAAIPAEAPQEGVVALGLLVGGYEDGLGRTYEIQLPSRSITDLHNSGDNPGGAWRGQTDVITRLVKGADLGSLMRAAMDTPEGQAAYMTLAPSLEGLEFVIPFNAMNLQDAVDFAVFAIRTTIDTQRLTYGTTNEVGSWPGVGGPIELAVVSGSEGFRWIQRTELQGERRAGEAESI